MPKGKRAQEPFPTSTARRHDARAPLVSDPSAAPNSHRCSPLRDTSRIPSSSPCSPVRRPRPAAEINGPVNHGLDSQPLREHRREQHPRVRDHPLIVEHDPRCVRQTIHYASDPLAQDPQPLARPVLPAQGVI
jgi:hypothetical protein